MRRPFDPASEDKIHGNLRPDSLVRIDGTLVLIDNVWPQADGHALVNITCGPPGALVLRWLGRWFLNTLAVPRATVARG